MQRRYDHRLRALVRTTGDLGLAAGHGVPRSTARGWLTRTSTEVVTLDVLELDTVRLQHEVILLRRRIARLRSLLCLVVTVLKVSGFSLSRTRLPEGAAKRQVLRAIERSRSHFHLRAVLRHIGLSHARYHDWIRNDRCGLDDSPPARELHRSNLHRPKSTPFETWSRPMNTGMCPRGPGSSCSATRQGLCLTDDMVSTRSRSRVAPTSAACSSGQAEGRHPRLTSQRDLACRHDTDPAARWQSGLRPRSGRQLLPTDSRMECCRDVPSRRYRTASHLTHRKA
jgi:hypothetical protein